MTALNAERYLREAIESILQQQTTRAWELLFVDDGSSDRTMRMAQEYAVRFPAQIHVLRHPDGRNHGISASRNLALRHARGALLAFLDADDVWLPHHLETQAGLLERVPQAAMVYAGAERWVDFRLPFDETAARAATWGRNYLPPLIPAGERTGLLPRGCLLQWFRADESFVPCICTVVVRAGAAFAVNGFCEDFRGLYDDQVFHAKISLQYEVYANDVCVARYRQHAESCCGRAHAAIDAADQERRRFESFLGTYVNSTNSVPVNKPSCPGV